MGVALDDAQVVLDPEPKVAQVEVEGHLPHETRQVTGDETDGAVHPVEPALLARCPAEPHLVAESLRQEARGDELAEAAEQEAGTLKNQWIPTEQALAAAKKAAAAGDFDTAVFQAQLADALAKASIAQAKEQQTAWRAGVIR